MSVARAREIAARFRATGRVCHEWTGWEARGNGQSSAYEGMIVHHTGSPSGSAYATLVDGRADLAGPLCNTAGNADGSITLVAAHPANHAGASGGRSMGPLPVTTLFNRRVWGHEIVYPGTSPMTPAQYESATVLGRIVADVCGYGDVQRVRAHAETSITGKWDPGYALLRTIDMSEFRRLSGLVGTGDDMALLQQDLDNIAAAVWAHSLRDATGYAASAAAWQMGTNAWAQAAIKILRQLAERPAADLDEAVLARELAPLLAGNLDRLSDDEISRLASALADEQSRRLAA